LSAWRNPRPGAKPPITPNRKHTLKELSAEQRKLMDDWTVNDFGVYAIGVQDYRVYRAKGCNIEIHVAQSSVDQRFRAASVEQIGTSHSSAPVCVRTVGYESRAYAIRTEAQGILARIQRQAKQFNGAHGKQHHSRVKAAIAGVEKFLKSNPHAQIGRER
jgi:hypothetical protein